MKNMIPGLFYIRYPVGFLSRYPESGRDCGQIFNIRLDVYPDIQYPAEYFKKSRVRPGLWPDIQYSAGYLSRYSISG